MHDDLILGRVQTTAIVVCVSMAALAAVVSRGSLGPAFAVVAGGVLAMVSYRLLASSAGDIVDAVALPPGAARAATPRVRAMIAGKLVGRYALLALLAYVMIARLRLHPLGLLVGASSVVAAIALEAVRFLLKKTP